MHAVVENSVPCALTPAEIEKASAEDMELNLIKECVQTGDWSQCNVPAYLHVKNELCTYGELLLRGSRLVIPPELRPRVLELSHDGHQGIVKTKCRLRSNVWWPKMDADAEKLCKRCHDVKQLVNTLPQNLWFEFSHPVALGKIVQLIFWVPYLQGKVYWWW